MCINVSWCTCSTIASECVLMCLGVLGVLLRLCVLMCVCCVYGGSPPDSRPGDAVLFPTEQQLAVSMLSAAMNGALF